MFLTFSSLSRRSPVRRRPNRTWGRAWLAGPLCAALLTGCQNVPVSSPRPPAPAPLVIQPQAENRPAPPPAPPPFGAPGESIETRPLGGPAPVLRAPRTDAIRIGLLLPLSGPNAAIGRALLDAAQLALFDLADDRLTLLPRDSEADADAARIAAENVLSEGASLIVGPLFATSVTSIAPLARARGVNMLTFSTDRNVAGNGVYLMGFTVEDQVDRVVALAQSRGAKHFGALTPDTPYGSAALAALRRSVTASGGEVVLAESYPPDSNDLNPVARRFAAAALAKNIDALLIPEGGAKLRALAPLLPYYDIDPATVKFLGTGLWDDPSIGSEPALTGGWFAGTEQDKYAEFRSRFEKTYGRRPPRIASIAYDAVALAGILARGDTPDPYSAAALGNQDGFAGYDGIFRFRPDGVAQRGLAVIEVQPRGFRVVDPAPSTFEAKTN